VAIHSSIPFKTTDRRKHKGESEMSKPNLADRLPRLSGDELQDWAAGVLGEITDRHVAASDILGWKIVAQHDGAQRWPFSGTMEGCTCPQWCNDVNNPFPMAPGTRRNAWDKAPINDSSNRP
jgi:hypothetical protein